MKLYYEIKDSVLDASGVTFPEKWLWKKVNDVYYPEQEITEHKFHNLVVEWMDKEGLPEFSLDELDPEDFTEEQWVIRNFFMDLFDLIENYPKTRQIDYLRKIQNVAKINVVSCNNCPSVFFHETGADHLVCPYCLVEGKPEDFSDLIHE